MPTFTGPECEQGPGEDVKNSASEQVWNWLGLREPSVV